MGFSPFFIGNFFDFALSPNVVMANEIAGCRVYGDGISDMEGIASSFGPVNGNHIPAATILANLVNMTFAARQAINLACDFNWITL